MKARILKGLREHQKVGRGKRIKKEIAYACDRFWFKFKSSSIIFLYSFSMASVTCGQQSKNTKREIPKINNLFFQLNILSIYIYIYILSMVLRLHNTHAV